MEKICINCNYFNEESHGLGKLDMEECCICYNAKSLNYETHVTSKDSCDCWVSDSERVTLNYLCNDCDFTWEINGSIEDYPENCPECNSDNIQEV